MPMDNNAFQYLDISGLQPATIAVTVENTGTTEVEGTVTTTTAGG